MMTNIHKGTVVLDNDLYDLLTLDDPACDTPKWIADTDLSGPANIVPYRDPAFEQGVTVQIVIEGRYYYRKLQLSKME